MIRSEHSCEKQRRKCEKERMDAERLLSNITNITIDGADLILDRVFDNFRFNRIDDEIFRKLVKARLSYPASKSVTVEYLKSAGTCSDHPNNTTDFTAKQANHLQDNAHETTSTYRPFI